MKQVTRDSSAGRAVDCNGNMTQDIHRSPVRLRFARLSLDLLDISRGNYQPHTHAQIVIHFYHYFRCFQFNSLQTRNTCSTLLFLCFISSQKDQFPFLPNIVLQIFSKKLFKNSFILHGN